MLTGRGADRDRGVRRQHRRPENPGRSDRQAQDPVRADQHRPGRGSRHAHQRAHPRRAASRAQLDWISALRADQIKVLVNDGALQLSLFDEQNLFEITHPDYPGERLVCCHNPALADERARKRAELLAATENELQTIAAATRRARRPLRGQDKIALRVGKVRNKFKMAKHFHLDITDEAFTLHPQPGQHRRRGRP